MGGFLIFLIPFAILLAALLVRRWIAQPADNPRDEGADTDPRLVEIARKGRD